MTNELVDELGFILTKDDKDKKPLITFETFLELVGVTDKPEAQIVADAKRIERLLTFYEHADVRSEWQLTFTQFLSKVRNGAWEQRFTA